MKNTSNTIQSGSGVGGIQIMFYFYAERVIGKIVLLIHSLMIGNFEMGEGKELLICKAWRLFDGKIIVGSAERIEKIVASIKEYTWACFKINLMMANERIS